MQAQQTIVCIHEDRQSHMAGLQLAAASLQQHSPELTIAISCPNPPQTLVDWVATRSNISLVDLKLERMGWNIKPSLLLHFLQAGYSQVIWLDSDIVVNGDLLSRIANYAPDVFVATEEPYWGQGQGGDYRTRAWGLTPARTFKATINSGLIRVTSVHLELIKAWQHMLQHPIYLQAQKAPGLDRPLHMIGDQEVLTALMGATDYQHIPVHLLKRGVDIAQCFGAGGYTVLERLRSLFSPRNPDLFHAMGRKPWVKPDIVPSLFDKQRSFAKNLRNYYDYVMLELSPFNVIAKQHIWQINEDKRWLSCNSKLSKLLWLLGLDSPNLTGLPLAMIDSAGKFIRRHLKIDRFSTDPKYFLKESPLQKTGQ